MRVFTSQEKWILKEISEIKKTKKIHSISLRDICIVFLKDEYLKVDYNAPTDFYNLEFLFRDSKYSVDKNDAIVKKQEEIENKIIDTILLLKFLKENNLLFEITDSETSDDFNIVKTDYDMDNHLTYSTNFDASTSKLVIETFVNKRFFIRQEFLDFSENGFKTIEGRRFRKSQNQTWIGIIIALLIGATSIYFVMFPIDSTIRIDEDQINQIETSNHTINSSLKKTILIDSAILKSINENFDVVNKNVELIKNKSTIKLNKYQYNKIKGLIEKTNQKLVELDSTLSNSITDSI